MGIYLGIDLGTSAVKCLALQDGAVLGVSSAALEVQSPAYGWSEQAPADWITAVRCALQDLSAQIDAAQVQAIGLSGQMHGLVACDADMTPLRPAMLWNDNRATVECADLAASLPGLSDRAGIPPLPGFNAPKMLWLARHEPALRDRLCHLLLPKDFVRYWLTGEVATDRSDAAGTLWFDQAKGMWDQETVEASGAKPDWMPPVLTGGDVAGCLQPAFANALGLPAGIPVVAGAGDAAAGAVGLGAIQPGRATLSLGTSAQLFLCRDKHAPNPARFLHAFAHTLPNSFYQMAAMLNGARPLAWLGQLLGIDAAQVLTLAAEADKARAPIFLPYLTGERSPLGDPNIRGHFDGLEDATTRAELCFAVTEAIAFSMADAADSFGAGLPPATDVLTLGGGARSDLLLQMVADATGLRLGRTEGAHLGPALGAAKLAGLGAGSLTQEDLSLQPPIAQWFDPKPQTPLTAARLDRYRNLYGALKDLTPPRASWPRS